MASSPGCVWGLVVGLVGEDVEWLSGWKGLWIWLPKGMVVALGWSIGYGWVYFRFKIDKTVFGG